jgi:hypothetical protein
MAWGAKARAAAAQARKGLKRSTIRVALAHRAEQVFRSRQRSGQGALHVTTMSVRRDVRASLKTASGRSAYGEMVKGLKYRVASVKRGSSLAAMILRRG